MENKDLKRGSEKTNPNSDEESTAKQRKLTEDEKMKTGEEDEEMDESDSKDLSPAEELHIDKACVLGRGGFGTVYKGSFRGTTAAIKEIICEGEDRKNIMHEITVTRKLHHPNIVRCLAASELNGAALLVLEYIPGASLDKVLHDKQCSIKLSGEDKISVSLDVLSAVEYAHSSNIIHQDMKPANILIDQRSRKALLTDWGLANIRYIIHSTVVRSGRIGEVGGTFLYMAPEYVLETSQRPTMMSDMWSVGATFIELFTNDRAWENDRVMRGHMNNKNPPPTLDSLGKNMSSIIRGCFSYNPQERPSASAMISAMKANK